jgi:type VI secretion system Hcp family effector
MSRSTFRPQVEGLEDRLALSTSPLPALPSQPPRLSIGILTEAPGQPGSVNGKRFEITDYSFDIEQVSKIGSPSSGAGAGKVTFDPFSVTRNIDVSSPQLFQSACSGTPLKEVGLSLRPHAGDAVSGDSYFFTFKLVAVKTISWSGAPGAGQPKETITFEYGAVKVSYAGNTDPIQGATGSWVALAH